MNHRVALPFSALTIAVFSLLGSCAGLEPFRKIACFEAARVSLLAAITLAERHMGGKAIDAGYRQDKEFGCLQNEPGVYDVALANGSAVDIVSVNADTGLVSPRETSDGFDAGQDVLERIIAPGHLPDADAAAQLALPITAAAAIAEEGGGKAMNVWAERKDGAPGYRVTLVENGKTRSEWIDGTGRRS